MTEKTNGKTLLQWHPAFYAGLQIEFEAEKEKLIFENEHQIGTKPKEIDAAVAEAVAEKDAYIKELETKLAEQNNK